MVTPGEEMQVLHLRVPLRVLLVPGASSPAASTLPLGPGRHLRGRFRTFAGRLGARKKLGFAQIMSKPHCC